MSLHFAKKSIPRCMRKHLSSSNAEEEDLSGREIRDYIHTDNRKFRAMFPPQALTVTTTNLKTYICLLTHRFSCKKKGVR